MMATGRPASSLASSIPTSGPSTVEIGVSRTNVQCRLKPLLDECIALLATIEARIAQQNRLRFVSFRWLLVQHFVIAGVTSCFL